MDKLPLLVSSDAAAAPSTELENLRAELAQAHARIAQMEEALQHKAQDDQERQRMERRLNARDALLKSLSKNIPGALFKVLIPKDREPQLQYISEKAAELYELDAQAVGLNWASHYDRIHPDDLDMVKQLSKLAPDEDDKLVRYEYRVILPQKGLRWLGGQSISIREANGDIAWYGYTSDVTEHKLYADAIISAQAAEHANLAKSEFLSRMSHELRTPLNAVIGFAQLLQMDRSQTFGEEQHRRVGLIEKAGQHLLSMLGDVLDLSRIEAGSLPLSIESVNTVQLVDEAVSMVSAQARANQIQVDTKGVACLAYAQADRVRVRQVLVNLLSNAIKYNRQGGTVAVRAWREQEQVLIEVRDSGIGMTAEQIQHLFEPFNRLGVERSGIEGTGIGLVIVRRLLNLMGGDIEVSSESGQGSCFTIRLPAANEEPLPSGHMALDEAEQSTTKPVTILYAEDNEVNVALVHQIVKLRPNWRLLVAMNGERALQLARRSLPDLMLIDIHLGDMTGFELAAELDRDESTCRIPRVALSADAMPDRIHAARTYGFKAYLTKPLDVLALLRCLDDQISGAPPGVSSGHMPL